MGGGMNAGGARSVGWRVLRNVIDLVVFTGLLLGSATALETLASDDMPMTRLIPLLGVPALALVFIWVLLRLQGQWMRDIGLGPVTNATNTALQGAAIAVLLFAIALATEAMGFERDFSSVRAELEGRPLNLLFFVVYAFIGAGLYEEAAFRGFALNRFARMLGEGRLAWPLAAVFQGVLFGLAHAHQGTYGMIYTGVLGALFGFVFLLNGRNLWPLVIGHGLYDATRFLYFYVVWTYLS